jgi:hypothetical protein
MLTRVHIRDAIGWEWRAGLPHALAMPTGGRRWEAIIEARKVNDRYVQRR